MYQWVLKQCGQKLFYLKLPFDLILEKFKVPANFFKVAVVYPWVCAKPDLDSISYKNVINQLTIYLESLPSPVMSNFLRKKIELNIYALHLYWYWRITNWSSNSGFALVDAY